MNGGETSKKMYSFTTEMELFIGRDKIRLSEDDVSINSVIHIMGRL